MERKDRRKVVGDGTGALKLLKKLKLLLEELELK